MIDSVSKHTEVDANLKKQNGKHLVNPIRNLSIGECYEKLKEAHKIIVECSSNKISELASSASDLWGTECKRILVEMPAATDLIGSARQKLSEMINQCATMERLLALLEWLNTSSEYARYKIDCCHPTTSSTDGENGLVLIAPVTGEKVRFEVWDCVAKKVNNDKLKKSLAKLQAGNQQSDRFFLVVSSELVPILTKKNFKANKCDERTYAFEVSFK
jgi:hypothetical protein